MTIKHLIISGGGPLGFRFIGALQKLDKENFWKPENTESIYCTSIGSIIGAIICLNYDWETLNKYVIERPWHEAFKITAKQILDSYYNKGLYNKKFIESIVKPLFQAKDIELNVTLKQFYEYSLIDLHIFTFELNKFVTVELSHTTHPDLELVEALTMSSALPGVFMPIFIDNNCFIDGGVKCNYPLNQCLRDHTNKDEILGIKMAYKSENDGTDCFKNINVTEDSSLLEYIGCFTINAMNFIRDTEKIDNIPNTIRCYIINNPLQFDYIQEAIVSQELRKKWVEDGEKDAEEFLQNRV